MDENCIFCKIAEGIIPSNKAYEDEWVLGFHDIEPQAPIHVLFIPKQHISSADALTDTDSALLMRMFQAAKKVAAELGVNESGYRLVTNVGADGGQSVPHFHLHLLGGRSLQWPPG